METKAKAKWFFIGLIAGWIPVVIAGVAFLAQLSPVSEMNQNPFSDITPDMGEELHEFGRSAEWNATHMPLGDSGFTAAAGPNRYTDKPDQDWDHYSVDVEKPEGKSSYVYFERDFRMNEIPRDLVDKKVQDIVTFDKESRVVTFDLGTKTETYTLPNR